MVERSNVREDIDIKNIFSDRYNKKRFNSTFEDMDTDIEHRQLMIIEEPEPMSISSKLPYTELGGKKPGDFTKSTNLQNPNTLNYYDYKTAHTQSKLIDKKRFKKREEYKNIDEYERARSNQSFVMTEKDKEYQRKKQEMEDYKEYKRRKRLKEKDIQIAQHFHKVNKLMLGS